MTEGGIVSSAQPHHSASHYITSCHIILTEISRQHSQMQRRQALVQLVDRHAFSNQLRCFFGVVVFDCVMDRCSHKGDDDDVSESREAAQYSEKTSIDLHLLPPALFLSDLFEPPSFLKNTLVFLRALFFSSYTAATLHCITLQCLRGQRQWPRK